MNVCHKLTLFDCGVLVREISEIPHTLNSFQVFSISPRILNIHTQMCDALAFFSYVKPSLMPIVVRKPYLFWKMADFTALLTSLFLHWNLRWINLRIIAMMIYWNSVIKNIIRNFNFLLNVAKRSAKYKKMKFVT